MHRYVTSLSKYTSGPLPFFGPCAYAFLGADITLPSSLFNAFFSVPYVTVSPRPNGGNYENRANLYLATCSSVYSICLALNASLSIPD